VTAPPIPTTSGAELLERLRVALTKFVVMPSGHAAVAVVLWIAASHAQPAWEHATRLVIKSPVKRCGKSRLLDLVAALAYNVLVSVNISPAALVRSIVENDPPTLLVDEVDTIFGTKRQADNHEDIRGLLNAGHQRGRPYVRWDATARRLEQCPTFAMAAMAGIGDLPDTIEDRAVAITMRRRAPGEQVTPLRRRNLPALHDLREALHQFMEANRESLADAEPLVPVEDRAADCWEPLIAVADLAGGDWPELARSACKAMTAAAEQGDGSLDERLLADVRAVFGDGEDKLPTDTLLKRLRALEEAPWDDVDGKGKPLDARGLANRLRPFDVRPKVLREGQKTPRGYERADLADAWRRYLPQQAQHPQQNGVSAGQSVADGDPAIRNTSATSESANDVLRQHESIRNALTSNVALVAGVAAPPRQTGGAAVHCQACGMVAEYDPTSSYGQHALEVGHCGQPWESGHVYQSPAAWADDGRPGLLADPDPSDPARFTR
jgi:hypothetical protein